MTKQCGDPLQLLLHGLQWVQQLLSVLVVVPQAFLQMVPHVLHHLIGRQLVRLVQLLDHVMHGLLTG